MAGDWIKFEHTTSDKPEVVKMSSRLKIDQDSVVGKLLRIWVWADLNSLDGGAAGVTSAFIDRLTCKRGFADAMRSVGWLTGEEGGLKFANFDRHNGSSAKLRGTEYRRKIAYRERINLEPNASELSRDCPKNNGTNPGQNTGLEKEEEKEKSNTEEERSVKTAPRATEEHPLTIPPALNTPAFLAPWAEWQSVRRKGKKPKTSWASYFSKQLAWLEPYGHDTAVQIVSESARNEWQGLFPPRGGNGQGTGRSDPRSAPWA